MIQLTIDNVIDNWSLIRFSAIKTSTIEEKNVEAFCRNLLISLLTGKSQCWFYLSPERKVVNVSITRIQVDVGNIPYLMIDSSYGFIPSTEDQKAEYIEKLTQFARNIGCSHIVAYTANPVAGNAMVKLGMKETFKVYSRKVGEDGK